MINRFTFLFFVILFLAPHLYAQSGDGRSSQKTVVSSQPVPNVASFVYQKNAGSILMIQATDSSGTSQGSGVAFRNGFASGPNKTASPISTWIITNAHVVKSASVVNVIDDSITMKGKVKYVDSDFDVAIIFVEEAVIKPVERLENRSILSPGEPVYAIGAPKGLSRTISEGIVSANRKFEEKRLIQTSAAISPGSSGGGLFEKNGKLIGINTFKVIGGESLNFALDAGHVFDLVRAVDAAAMIEAFTGNGFHPNNYKFVKWLASTKAGSGGMVIDEYGVAEEAFLKNIKGNFEEAEKKFGDYLTFILDRYNKIDNDRSRNLSKSQTGTAYGNSANVFNLLCQLRARDGEPIPSTFTVDSNKRTVNGFNATFTDGYIRFEKNASDGAKLFIEFNRVASTVSIVIKILGLLVAGLAKKLRAVLFEDI